MKAMILAAGRGERLRPLTDTLPKPLVSIAQKPLIVYHIEKLAAVGIKEIVINLAWLGDKMMAVLGTGDKWGVKLYFSHETQALETGGGIKQALPFLGPAPFLVINGDIFIDELPPIPILHQDEQAYLWLVDNPLHHLKGDFSLSKGKINLSGMSQLTFSGIGLYRPELFLACQETQFPLASLLKEKIKQGQVGGKKMHSFWCDVGTIDRLQALEVRQSYGNKKALIVE